MQWVSVNSHNNGTDYVFGGFHIPVHLPFVYPSGKCKKKEGLSGTQETGKRPGERKEELHVRECERQKCERTVEKRGGGWGGGVVEYVMKKEQM